MKVYNTIKTSFKIENTCSINAFIYRIRNLPGLKKIIPKHIYGSNTFKVLIQIIVLISRIISPFISKIFYVGIMILIPMHIMDIKNINVFSNILLFITLWGALSNTQILSASTKKYHCVNLMKIEPKKYEISHYILFLVKTFISFFPILMIAINYISNSFDVILILYVIILDILILSLKIIDEAFHLYVYSKKNIVLIDNKYTFIISVMGFVLTYILSYFRINISFNGILILSPFIIVLAIICIRFLFKNNSYKRIYKKVFTLNKIIFDVDTFITQTNKDNYKKISSSSKITEDIERKEGYDYFNSIFFYRHKKLVLNSAKNYSLVYLVVVLIIIALCIFVPESRVDINNVMINSLPYFVFIMYLTNRGSEITQAMFFNCDHSLLTYKFYRNPKHLLNIFIARLKKLILINLLPATVLGSMIPIILFLSGGIDNNLIYFSIFLFIIFLSIFFTVHHLVLYYLLQPYDINMKSRSMVYSVMNFITYLLCYKCMSLKVHASIFSIISIIATLLYILLALCLVYKFAPRTFKLK